MNAQHSSHSTIGWAIVLAVAILAIAAVLITWIQARSFSSPESGFDNRDRRVEQVGSDQAISNHSTEDQISMGSEVQIYSDDWRELNVFFSNFAEAFVEPFREGSVPDETLICFGFKHNVINREQYAEAVPNERVGFHVVHIENAIQKYFGVRFTRHRSVESMYCHATYADGYYIFSPAAGEAYPFAQVDHMISLGERKFSADLRVYRIGDYPVDQYGTPVRQLRRLGYDVEQLMEIRARIKKVRTDDNERYILLEYLLAD